MYNVKKEKMIDFVNAVSNLLSQEKGVCYRELSYMEMPTEKEKYNLSKIIGNVNLIEGRYKIETEAENVIDNFLSLSLP
jgi:hypothetical protein